MRLPIILLVFVATSTSFVIPDFRYDEQDEKIKRIIKKYEKFYETLSNDLKEDAHLLAPELIQKYGYQCEVHTVVTEDGYILEMHRIPYKMDQNANSYNNTRPAVFVQHGLLSSSADWITPGPGKGLGYVLADHGYDVWLANVRGNRYSRNHTHLDPRNDAKKFWDFTWHEIAMRDLPAMVDYVINTTNQDKIFYIGHSQGTTVSYVLLSKLPEYNDKFRAVFSLAPSAYMQWMYSPILRLVAKYEKSLGFLANIIGLHEFAPRTELLAIVAPILCGDESILQILCLNAIFAISGFNPKQMNATLLPLLLAHFPAGAASKQIRHYGQSVNSWEFQEWDYGTLGNLLHYGKSTPPRYELENINAPLYIFYSLNDWLSHPSDVERLSTEISNLQQKILVADELFNHIDYVIGIDAPDFIFKPIINLMRRH